MTLTFPLDAVPTATPDELRLLIGGKAANLGVMSRDLGLPVPPGFVISTATCRTFLADGWPAGLDAELRTRMGEVETALGRRFGDPRDPLLVSVRSGAPVSMPGMLDTVLDLGLNDDTTEGLARSGGGDAFAKRCRDRFESSFRSIVGVADVPVDPWLQLRAAIEAVFRSWNGERARAYRQREGIPDDLGTAVIVQAMVFGNRGERSATGVLFTRDPATGAPTLYGDVMFDAQGEDVVAGTHRTDSIAALDERLPAVAAELREDATRLERHFADMCDIEFTIEDGRLWMLQTRIGKRSPQAAVRIAVDMAEDPTFLLSKAEAVERVRPLLASPPTVATARGDKVPPLLVGLPASPGVASGPIALTPEGARDSAEAGVPTILVRAETSPDDVFGMARAAGILTSRGGLASHAAVVARGWGIPAVVGAAALEVRAGRVVIGETVLEAGDIVTIDGSSGEVFAGTIPGSSEIVPEGRTLQAWARELGIDVSGEPAAAAPSADTGQAVTRAVTQDRCVQVIGIKGYATTQGVADAVLATPDDVAPLLEQLVVDGLVESSAGAYRLTRAGTARATELLDAERAAWGAGGATDALDSFLDLDQRAKDTVTAWQLRDDRDGHVLNDHSNPAYDQRILGDLATLHTDVIAWLAPLEAGCARLADYGVRLGRAVELALGEDQRYVASPRVDSYHGIWFELHEDLIQLAGRSREDEIAAGRA